MCGIAGIVHFDHQNADEIIVRRMTNAMSHRGPDADGIFTEGEIGLGHRRLSIIDLSSAANQPFSDHTSRFVIVFNGEMYNYGDVKAVINDYPFRTTGDTETLVAAFGKWGTECMSHFRGMYAFALWDKKEKELYLVRDPMGVKPLYYFIDDKKIIFASEVRSILATGLVPRKLKKEAVYEYLSYQSLSYPYTFVEGISQLEAGSWMKIKNGKIEKKNFWSLFSNQPVAEYESEEQVKKNIYTLLGRSIQQRLVSDVPVGSFLSGGIDSSVVVGLMSQVCGVRPNTFNISFAEKEFDESAYAEIVAQKFGANHSRIQLSPSSMLDELENALGAMDSPSGDGINTYVVSKAIRNKGIKVALSGIGGDELFAGYPIFGQFKKMRQYNNVWKNSKLIRHLLAGIIPGRRANKNQRLIQLLKMPLPDIEFVYPLLRQLNTPAQIKDVSNLNDISQTALSKYLEDNKAKLHQLPLLSQVSAAEYLGYTQQTLLKDTDQMSMAVALEVREPFFDIDLVHYVLGIPDRFKQPKYPKSLLVEAVKPLLPNEIVFRKKQGFLFPWKSWMRNELKTFCSNAIQKLSERDFIKRDALLDYWKRFLSGDETIRWMDVWLFVVLEYWLEKNNVE